MSGIGTITAYYSACSAGDVEGVRATVTDDVVHYFLAPNTGSAPVRGGEHLGRYWRKVQAMIDARWTVDHALSAGSETVIEWTMTWRPPGFDHRVATRGAEWFVLAADGRIAEIRSYYQQRPETTELDGFPYAERGYTAAAAGEIRPSPTGP